MTASAGFWKWLSSDWGKPNILTRAGVPRIVTNLLTYLLVPYLSYLLAMKYAPVAYKPTIRLLAQDPLILLAYGVFYVTLATDWFLHFRYSLKGTGSEERFRLYRNWKNLGVRVFWLSLAMSLILLLLGAFYLRFQMR